MTIVQLLALATVALDDPNADAVLDDVAQERGPRDQEVLRARVLAHIARHGLGDEELATDDEIARAEDEHLRALAGLFGLCGFCGRQLHGSKFVVEESPLCRTCLHARIAARSSQFSVDPPLNESVADKLRASQRQSDGPEKGNGT